MSDLTFVSVTGGSKRSLQQTGATSPAVESRSTKRLKSLERVLSVGTVLQCVDSQCDKEGPFDAAVGQMPATVHEVTEGINCHQFVLPPVPSVQVLFLHVKMAFFTEHA